MKHGLDLKNAKKARLKRFIQCYQIFRINQIDFLLQKNFPDKVIYLNLARRNTNLRIQKHSNHEKYIISLKPWTSFVFW